MAKKSIQTCVQVDIKIFSCTAQSRERKITVHRRCPYE